MKTKSQKRKAFGEEMEKLKKDNNLKEESQPFTNLLKKAATLKKQKPSSR